MKYKRESIKNKKQNLLIRFWKEKYFNGRNAKEELI